MFLMIAIIAVIAPKTYAQISIDVSIRANVAPPALPVYVQPACPTDGYMWVPGYWAYDNDSEDYYWVPGVWVAPPSPGLLWTPAYWGYEGGVYGFHAGYWGPHVGFYGGINYGYGYGGHGYGGGVWSGNSFRYNTAVVNVDRTVVHNTYIDRTVVVNVNNHNSFNGPGGVEAKPRPEELAAMREQHVQPTSAQISHEHTASQDKSQFAKANHGKPAAVAMNKVGGNRFTSGGTKAAPRAGNDASDKNANNADRNKPNNANGDANKNDADNANKSRNNNANADANKNNADNADKSRNNNVNADKAPAAHINKPANNNAAARANKPAANRQSNVKRPQQQQHRAPAQKRAPKPEKKQE